MITYDLTAKRLTGLSRPAIRYSNAAQRMTVRLTGTMPAAARWIASVALNSKTSAEVVLSRTTEGQVTVSGNDVIIDWQTDTTTWLAACAGKDTGVTATCVIRPLDAAGEELDYIAFALLALPAIDPLGVIDQPSQVAAQTIISVNGAVGALSIRNSAGTELSVVNGVITLDKAVVGLGNVSNLLDNLTATAAPTATDDSSKGYSKKSQWIYAGKFYTCVDATPGAAIWTECGGAPFIDNRVWYVSPDGTGAAPGTAAAPASFAAAMEYAATGVPLIINLAAGLYTMTTGVAGVAVSFVGVGATTDFRANGTMFTNSSVRFTNLKSALTPTFNGCDISFYFCTGTGITVRGGRATIYNTAFAGTVTVLSGAIASIYGGSIATLSVSDASRAYVSAGTTITNASPAVNVEGNNRSMIVYGGA